MGPLPKISVLHPTARIVGDGWRAACEQLVRNADRPHEIEYILVVDGSENNLSIPVDCSKKLGGVIYGVNAGRRTSSDAYNEAGHLSIGEILLCMQDDIWVPEHWDTELLRAAAGNDPLKWPFVIRVSSITARDEKLYNPQIFSRARYEQCGYVFWPEYLSMYADNEFTEAARLDQSQGECAIFDARHLHFEERHPAFGTAPDDEIYRHENRQASYVIGKEVFDRRKAQGFPKHVPYLLKSEDEVLKTLARKQPPSISVCMPGEHFSQGYLANWSMLLMHLAQRFNVRLHFGYHTDVYACRNWFVDRIREAGMTDWVVWFDDDNLLSPEAFDALYGAMQQPDAPDLLAAWCWIFNQSKQQYSVSCGTLIKQEDGQTFNRPDNPKLFSGAVEPKEYTGFPAVLHRGCIFDKLGPRPFDKIPGVPGEDIAFCVRIKEAGLKVGVHTGVKIPHLKLVNLDPSLDAMEVKDE